MDRSAATTELLEFTEEQIGEMLQAQNPLEWTKLKRAIKSRIFEG
jgi:hypothetical protein